MAFIFLSKENLSLPESVVPLYSISQTDQFNRKISIIPSENGHEVKPFPRYLRGITNRLDNRPSLV
jgi:hypothetical protein